MPDKLILSPEHDNKTPGFSREKISRISVDNLELKKHLINDL
jgi:hypothetical protein